MPTAAYLDTGYLDRAGDGDGRVDRGDSARLFPSPKSGRTARTLSTSTTVSGGIASPCSRTRRVLCVRAVTQECRVDSPQSGGGALRMISPPRPTNRCTSNVPNAESGEFWKAASSKCRESVKSRGRAVAPNQSSRPAFLCGQRWVSSVRSSSGFFPWRRSSCVGPLVGRLASCAAFCFVLSDRTTTALALWWFDAMNYA